MDMIIVAGIAILALFIFGNIRLIIACALIAAGGAVYYQQLEEREQEKWEQTYNDYKKRCIRAWNAFNA